MHALPAEGIQPKNNQIFPKKKNKEMKRRKVPQRVG
jgi:hypothetical protein